MNLLDRLDTLRLLVVTGKGGVGKSTMAAALGLLIARAGRRVLLLEADAREGLYHMLDVSPSGGENVVVGPRLQACSVRPRDVLDGLVRERVRFDFVADRVIDSPVYRHFVESAPGLKELAVLGHAYESTKEPETSDVDIVVLDAPASGHGLSLLAAPSLVSEVIPHGPVGALAEELASFTRDPQRCGVVVVTRAEEMPVTETIELLEALDAELDRRPELVVVNALYPAVPDSIPHSADADEALELWKQRRRVNEVELERLADAWSGLRVDLPLLPYDRGSRLTLELSRRLEQRLSES